MQGFCSTASRTICRRSLCSSCSESRCGTGRPTRTEQHAADLMNAIAEDRGWTRDELSDRTVPTGGSTKPACCTFRRRRPTSQARSRSDNSSRVQPRSSVDGIHQIGGVFPYAGRPVPHREFRARTAERRRQIVREAVEQNLALLGSCIMVAEKILTMFTLHWREPHAPEPRYRGDRWRSESIDGAAGFSAWRRLVPGEMSDATSVGLPMQIRVGFRIGVGLLVRRAPVS